jgi:hypothetical protein
LRIIIIAHPTRRSEEINDLQQLNGERLTIIRAKDDLLPLPSSSSLALINNNKLGYFGLMVLALSVPKIMTFYQVLLIKWPAMSH